jgi:hypothetical protein
VIGEIAGGEAGFAGHGAIVAGGGWEGNGL